MSKRPGYLLDAAVLVALTSPDHVHHSRAHKWFAGIDVWATCPMTEAAFLRLMMNPLVAGTSRSSAEVLAVLRALRALPGHTFIPDDSSLAEASIDLAGLQGYRQVTDLHLVNLAARHALVLATLDAKIAPALVGVDRESIVIV